MIDPHREKYHSLYWDMAYAAADQSEARKRKVGAILVLPTGMLSIGWNGLPSGFKGGCEEQAEDRNGPYMEGYKMVTRPEVIHAERNAIDKMTRQGVPTEGSILFTTYAPCFECAKAIHSLGLEAVYYAEHGNHMEGLDLLEKAGVRAIHTPQTIYHLGAVNQ